MRSVSEIYREYRIMPALQLHQLRVAAVGKLICDNFKGDIDTRDVVTACLFHDMGNIIKSDLVTFPEFLEPEGKEYWQKVKDEYIEKYGTQTHEATKKIARELSLPETIIEIINCVGFSNLKLIQAGDSFEQKITEYSDTRAAPHGILSMEDRLEDARKRYKDRVENNEMPDARKRYDAYIDAAREIERQIFARSSLKPGDINDDSVVPLIEELREFPVE